MADDSPVVARIKALGKGIVESEQNANNLVDLMEFLEADDVATATLALRALCKVYCHLLQLHSRWLGLPTAVGAHTTTTATSRGKRPEGGSGVTEAYRGWMRRSYRTFVEELEMMVQRVSHGDMQALALAALMKLVAVEGSAHQAHSNCYLFPNPLFHHVGLALLNTQTNMCNLIGRFAEYLVHDDVRFYWLKTIVMIVERKRRAERLTPEFVLNVFYSLKEVVMPHSEKELVKFYAGSLRLKAEEEEEDRGDEEGLESEGEGEDEEEEEEEEEEEREFPLPSPKRRKQKKMSKQERKSLSVADIQQHRRHFSEAWLAFLRLPLTFALYKQVLVLLHSRVMPHLLQPQQLTDFLVEAYDSGGVISLLALNGLYLLMSKYNLEYPEFFPKLYALLKPEIFHVEYMPRFFSLLSTFLTSTHLPLYLVAAFAKRLARLLLTAPPDGVMAGVVLVTNLVRRHPNCRVLLHRPAAEGAEMVSDPFDFSEPDLAKCGALDSCLWELKTLQSHYSPEVSGLVKRLLSPDLAVEKGRREEELGRYLHVEPERLFRQACTDLSKETSVPMNFVKPTGLWLPSNLEVT